MFCKKCGAPLPESGNFCPRCGARFEENPPFTAADTAPSDPQNEVETAPAWNSAKSETHPNNSPSKLKKHDKLLPVMVFSGITLLMIAVITIFFITKNHDFFGFAKETVTIEHPNTEGNTSGNIEGGGIATIQDQTIYYLQEDYPHYSIQSMDSDGKNEKELYTFNEDYMIKYLNIIGSRMFFVGNKYDKNINLLQSAIYTMDLNDLSPKPIYVSAKRIYNLKAMGEKLYFWESDEDKANKIGCMNFDGSEVQTLLEQDNYFYSFMEVNASLYYINGDTVQRCDLDGGNHTEIKFSEEIYRCCVTDPKIYAVVYDDEFNETLVSTDLDGNNETEILTLDKRSGINHLTVVGDQIYYVLNYLDDDYEVVSTDICTVKTDGSDPEPIVSINGKIYYLNICGDWLFYYNPETLHTEMLNIGRLN